MMDDDELSFRLMRGVAGERDELLPAGASRRTRAALPSPPRRGRGRARTAVA
jgi:hypothetical protein